MRFRAATTLLALPLVLLACGGDDADDPGTLPPGTADPVTTPAPGTEPESVPPSPTDPPTDATGLPGGAALPAGLTDRMWVLDGRLSIAGVQPAPPAVQASVEVTADGNVRVNGGCNTGSAQIVEVDGTALTLGPLAMTMKACTDEDVSTWEQTVVSNLQDVTEWVVAGDVLVVTPLNMTDSGLQFRDADAAGGPATTLPTGGEASTPEALAGAAWNLVAVQTTETTADTSSATRIEVPAEYGAAITFERDGRAGVATGCNQGSADVTYGDATLTMGPILLTRMACLDGDRMAIEQALVTILADEVTWAVQHQNDDGGPDATVSDQAASTFLTLTAADGSELVLSR